MNILKTTLFITVCLSTYLCNAQKGVELGIHFSQNDTRKALLDVRFPLGEKYTLKVGGAYGYYRNWPGHSAVLHTTDTTYTQQSTYYSNYYGAFVIGASRQLGESVFSITSDLSVGVRHSKKGYNQSTYTLNEAGEWEYEPVSWSLLEPNPNGSEVINYHLYMGLFLGGTMNLPVGDRFVIELLLGSYNTYYTPVGQTIKSDNLNVVEPNDHSFFNFDALGSIGVRYKFLTKQDK
ncbi:MAG: hypothetical protein WDZ35_09745 [Crocinitomicaceae bacterium]